MHRRWIASILTVLLALGTATTARPMAARGPAAPAVLAASITLEAQIGGALTGLVVDGRFGYTVIGPRFVVLDLSDPTRIREYASTPLPDFATYVASRIVADGDLVHVLVANYIVLTFDVSDPAHLRHTDWEYLPAYVEELVVVAGRRYYLNRDKLYRDSGSAAKQPIALHGPNSTMVGIGDEPYLVAADATLWRLDPDGSPAIVPAGRLPGATHAYEPVVGPGGYLYVVDYPGLAFQVRAYDMKVPDQPRLVGSSAPLSGNVTLAADSQTLVGHSLDTGNRPPSELVAFDATDPTLQRELGRWTVPTISWAFQVVAHGGRTYVVEGGRIQVFTPGAAGAPIAADRFSLPVSSISAVVTDGQHAFVLDLGSDARLAVLDVRRPADPVLVAERPGYSLDLALAGGALYLVDCDANALTVLAADATLAPLATVGAMGRMCHFEVSADRQTPVTGLHPGDGFLVAALINNGTYILDTRQPTAPRIVSRLTAKLAYLNVVGTRLVGVEWDGAVIVVDLSDPARPRELVRTAPGEAMANGALLEMKAVGSMLYLARAKRLVAGYDLSDPARPRRMPLPNDFPLPWAVGPDGIGYGIQNSYMGELVAMDLSVPAHPRRLASAPLPGHCASPSAMAAARGRVFVVDSGACSFQSFAVRARTLPFRLGFPRALR